MSVKRKRVRNDVAPCKCRLACFPLGSQKAEGTETSEEVRGGGDHHCGLLARRSGTDLRFFTAAFCHRMVCAIAEGPFQLFFFFSCSMHSMPLLLPISQLPFFHIFYPPPPPSLSLSLSIFPFLALFSFLPNGPTSPPGSNGAAASKTRSAE